MMDNMSSCNSFGCQNTQCGCGCSGNCNNACARICYCRCLANQIAAVERRIAEIELYLSANPSDCLARCLLCEARRELDELQDLQQENCPMANECISSGCRCCSGCGGCGGCGNGGCGGCGNGGCGGCGGCGNGCGCNGGVMPINNGYSCGLD